jgi:hypothetical protein
MADKDILEEAQELFRQCEERDKDNRDAFEADIKFARLEQQWDEDDERDRREQGRPTHTINKLAPIIRQVVNDARQNKPAITVRPQDSKADVETAEILSGLVRNIESSSNADVAYDTAVENAVSGGFGYIRVNIDYAHDDTFDKDILIDRVANPLSVFGDPESFSSDGDDWNVSFVMDQITQDAFEKQHKDADPTPFVGDDYPDGWYDGDHLTIAEFWKREEEKRQIVQLSDGSVMGLKDFEAQAEYFYSLGVQPVGEPRDVRSYNVVQRIITGKDVLETNKWPGCNIPIIPVYGDEVVLKNKRYLRSLIRSAKSSQQRYNVWMSSLTEMALLAPKSPYIGEEGAFDADPEWANANSANLPYLAYKKGMGRPERQQTPQISPAMMQEALSAAEDIKAVTGIYVASLGARSNEVSGVAINARQREGDVSTFHFADNLTRSIRQVGRIVVDLIPKIYTQDRVIRVLGEDGKSQQVTLGQPHGEGGRIYDLSMGKYDVSVKAGPSYTTQREETRAELVEIIKAVPDSAKVLGPMYLRNSDWPGAEDAADLLEGKGEQQLPPEVQEHIGQMQQIIQQGGQELQRLQQENEQLKQANDIKAAEVEVKGVEAQARLIEANAKMWTAQNPPPVVQTQPQKAEQPAGNPFAVEGSA